VLDASSVVAAAEVVKEADGRLDVLVNNVSQTRRVVTVLLQYPHSRH
jgi:NAD(P)-dependent dehydrogenase (short-subunit alcohol dehydrogenase family)